MKWPHYKRKAGPRLIRSVGLSRAHILHFVLSKCVLGSGQMSCCSLETSGLFSGIAPSGMLCFGPQIQSKVSPKCHLNSEQLGCRVHSARLLLGAAQVPCSVASQDFLFLPISSPRPLYPIGCQALGVSVCSQGVLCVSGLPTRLFLVVSSLRVEPLTLCSIHREPHVCGCLGNAVWGR
jgi:hypothetical protein